MRSEKSLELNRAPSVQRKSNILSDSAMLTKSEIESLRQGKKRIADFVLKELKARPFLT
jgi:hypothetical protein